jgi:excisionase family DNA binding protein
MAASERRRSRDAMFPSTELWRVARVATHLDVSKKRVYTLIQEGQLETMRLSRRGTRVLRRSVEEYVRRRLRAEAERRRMLAEAE